MILCLLYKRRRDWLSANWFPFSFFFQLYQPDSAAGPNSLQVANLLRDIGPALQRLGPIAWHRALWLGWRRTSELRASRDVAELGISVRCLAPLEMIGVTLVVFKKDKVM